MWQQLVAQHSALSCAVSLSVSFSPVYPAERCVLNGKVTVVLKGVSVVVMNCHFDVGINNVST